MSITPMRLCGDDLDLCRACEEHPEVAYLFEPLTPETLANMRREASVPAAVAWAVSLLSPHRWATAAVLSRRTGVPRKTLGGRLLYAIQIGAPIESDRRLGYRLTGRRAL